MTSFDFEKKSAAAAAASGADLSALLAELSSAVPVALSVNRSSASATNASERGEFSSSSSLTPNALFGVDGGGGFGGFVQANL